MTGTATRIIGIDPGLRFTGWGVIASDGSALRYIAAGVVASRTEDDLAQRLVTLYNGLREVVATHCPAEAAIEQTFVSRDAGATLKLGQARGIALLVPALQGIGIAEYAPNTIKKTVVGVGHCDKRQIRTMIDVLLPRAKPKSDDAADALAIAITHAQHRRRSLSLPPPSPGKVA